MGDVGAAWYRQAQEEAVDRTDRTEWGVEVDRRLYGSPGVRWVLPAGSEAAAGDLASDLHPDGSPVVVRRTVTTLTTAWKEVAP